MRRVVLKQAFLLALLLASVVAGCSGESSTAGQDTPRAVLKKMQGAITEWNKKQYMACFAGPEGYLKFAEATFDVTQATSKFKKALISVHGQEGWEKFQSRPEGGASLETNLPDPKWADEIEVVIDGSTARFKDPQSGVESRMVCKDGVWRIDAQTLMPAQRGVKPEPEKAADFMLKWVKVIKEVTEEIGKPGVEVKDLNKMLAERLFGI